MFVSDDVKKYEPLKGIGVIFLYLFLEIAFAFLPFSTLIKNILLDITLIILLVVIFRKELLCSIKDYKHSLKEYLKFFVKSQLLIFLIYFLSCFVQSAILSFEDVSSLNQQTAESLPYLYLFISAVFIAPVVEELVFRCGIFKIFKNKYLQILVSGIAFGLLHTLAEETWYYTFVLGIPYVTMGVCFATIYHKKDNILCPILSHMFYNFISCLALLI